VLERMAEIKKEKKMKPENLKLLKSLRFLGGVIIIYGILASLVSYNASGFMEGFTSSLLLLTVFCGIVFRISGKVINSEKNN